MEPTQASGCSARAGWLPPGLAMGRLRKWIFLARQCIIGERATRNSLSVSPLASLDAQEVEGFNILLFGQILCVGSLDEDMKDVPSPCFLCSVGAPLG